MINDTTTAIKNKALNVKTKVKDEPVEEEKVGEDEGVEKPKRSVGMDKEMIGKKRQSAPTEKEEDEMIDTSSKKVNKSVNVQKEKKRMKTK